MPSLLLFAGQYLHGFLGGLAARAVSAFYLAACGVFAEFVALTQAALAVFTFGFAMQGVFDLFFVFAGG